MSVVAAPRPDGLVASPGSGDLKSGDLNSIGKAVALLGVFAESGPWLTGSQLARAAGLPKSTAFRILSQLIDAGYVVRSGLRYGLGMRLFELGNQVPVCRAGGLRETARPYLAELVRPGTVVHLAVLEDREVLYLDKLVGPGGPRTPTAVGGRLPATCSALGKVILAHSAPENTRHVVDAGLARRTPYSIVAPGILARQLETIRQQRVAFDNEEAARGLTCVAAPLLVGGHLLGAISMSGPVPRFDAEAAAPAVRRAAAGTCSALSSGRGAA